MLNAFIYSQLISQLSSAITGFSLLIVLYSTTESVTSISLIYFFQVLPLLFFSQICGKIVDKLNRKVIILCSDIVSISCLLLLYFIIENKGAVEFCYILISLMSLCAFISGMSVVALISGAITDIQRPLINSLLNLVQLLPRLFGPALSVFILGEGSFSIIILINVILCLLSFIPLFYFPYTHYENENNPVRFLSDLFLFVKTIKKHPQMLATLLCVATSSFMTGVIGTYIVPIGVHYGSLTSSAIALMIGGLGSMLGVFFLKKYIKVMNFKSIRLILAISTLQIVTTVIFPIVPGMLFIYLLCFVFFLLSPIVKGLSQSLWQGLTSNEIYGLIFSYKASLLLCVNLFSFILVGVLADKVLLKENVIPRFFQGTYALQFGISFLGLITLSILIISVVILGKYGFLGRIKKHEI